MQNLVFLDIQERRHMPLLEISGISKLFGGLAALSDVSFRIADGETLSIIGPNGAGKSTLFNVMTGFQRRDTGTIDFQGEDISQLPPHSIVRRGIARIFQVTSLFPHETVHENLMIGYRMRTRSGIIRSILRTGLCREEYRTAQQRAEDIADFVGLSAQLNLPASSLPQEAQKRLSIGIALVTEPVLLLLDEPVGGMSLEEGDRLVELIGRVRERNITVCLIEHRMRVVMNISDRIVVLNHGKKIAEGLPEEIRSNQEVIEAYLGEEYAA
jgi:branched-chain amino acid transport system ATP-binding protein